MKIVVVAEHAALRAQIGALLRELGYDDALDAATGAEALALLREVAVGMVIAQMDMTPMSGSQLHAAMRADPRLRDIRFLPVTIDDLAGIGAAIAATARD